MECFDKDVIKKKNKRKKQKEKSKEKKKRRFNDEKKGDEQDGDTLCEEEYFDRKDGTIGILGDLYAIDYIMYLFLISKLKIKSGEIEQFKIGFDLKMATKCDDIFLKHVDKAKNKKCYFIQLKHGGEDQTFNFNELFLRRKNNKCNFDLHKYFMDFMDIQADPHFADSEINIIYLCTKNCNFESLLKNGNDNIEKYCDNNSFISFKEDNHYYGIKLKGSMDKTIRKCLSKATERHKLASAIVDRLKCKGKDIKQTRLVTKYYTPLIERIFEKLNDEYIMKKNFINDENLTEEETLLRRTIIEEIETTTNIDNIEENPLRNEESTTFDIHPENSKIQSEDSLPTDHVTDEDMEKFLSKFRLWFKQPGHREFEEKIPEMLGMQYPACNVRNLFLNFRKEVENRYTDKSQKLKYITEKDEMISKKFRFQVRSQVSIFTGREKELNEIYDYLHNCPNQVTPILNISGFRGIGKTELVRKYISSKKEHNYDDIIWINCEDCNKFTRCYKRLAADYLNIKTKNDVGEDKEITTIIEEVYKNLNGKSTLTILDDNDNYEFLSNVVNASKQGGMQSYIIMTSQTQTWNGIKQLKLGVLQNNEAELLINKGLGAETQVNSQYDKEKEMLIKEIQNYPLALAQAISYIKNNQITITEYLEILERNSKQALDDDSFQGIYNEYFKTTYSVCKATCEQLQKAEQGNNAYKILKSMAYMDSEYIDINLFSNWSGMDRTSLKDAVMLLINYSIINDHGRDVVSIHKVVQDSIKHQLVEGEQEEATIEATLQLFQPQVSEANINHALLVWRHATKYHFLDKFCSMPIQILEQLCKNKRYLEANNLGQLIYPGVELIKHNCKNAWKIKLNIAAIHKKTHEFHKALNIFKNVLDELKKTNTEINDIIRTEYKMASILNQQFNLEEAKDKLLNILSIQKKYNRPSSEIIKTKFKLATVYVNKIEDQNAEQQYEEIDQMSRDSEKETETRETLRTRYKRAVLQRLRGHNDQALQGFQNVHKMQILKLGDKDSETLKSLHNIACLQKSPETIRKVLKFQGDGEDDEKSNDLETIESRQALAVLMVTKEQESKESMEKLQLCQDSLRTNYGENHMLYRSIINDTAGNYWNQGYRQRAKDMYEVNLKIYLENLNEYHPQILITKCNITGINLENGEKTALKDLKEIYEKLVQIQGENNPCTLECKTMIEKWSNN